MVDSLGSSFGSDESNDDLAWLEDADDESRDTDSLGSFVVDSSDWELELKPNLTEDQAINQEKLRSDIEDDEIGREQLNGEGQILGLRCLL